MNDFKMRADTPRVLEGYRAEHTALSRSLRVLEAELGKDA